MFLDPPGTIDRIIDWEKVYDVQLRRCVLDVPEIRLANSMPQMHASHFSVDGKLQSCSSVPIDID